MSENVPRKMRFVAMAAALLAMVFALVAVIVVVTRGGEPEKPSANVEPSAKVEPAPLRDHDVRATDVVRLRTESELVVEKGTVKGLRIKDAALAQSLGLEEGDVIAAVSGKPMTSERDAYDVITKLSMMSATTLYVEVTHEDRSTLLRWRLDGDLRQARYGALGSRPSGSLGTLGSSYTPSYRRPTPDPLLDTIVKVDDSHYKVPRKTVDEMLNNVEPFMRGARVVPAIRNGKPNGFKMYAIRPSSVFSRFGFMNGDTLHAINGMEMTRPDSMIDAYSKVRNADKVTFELTRRGRPVALTVEITK